MTRRLMCLLVLATFALLATWPSGQARAEDAKKMSLDDAFKAVAAYKFGQSRECQTVVEDAVRDSAAKPDDRAALAKRLSGLLSAADATLDAKQFACRQISVIGTAAEVPAVSALLLDKDLSDYARYALERIPLPEAVAAVRAAMPKATERMKVGLINTLGVRRDAQSVSALAALLADKDAMIAGAAAAALGKIGGTDAAKALADFRGKAPAELKAIVTDAYLVAADQFVKDGKKDAAEAIYKEIYVPAESKAVRVAALTGLVATQGEKALAVLAPLMTGDDVQMQVIALRLAQGIPGAEATKALAAMLPKLPAGAQIMLANQLGERGDAAAAPALIEAAKSDNESVRVASLRALGGVGDVSTVPVLVKAAAVGSTAGAATDALGRLKGADVDAALVKTLDGADVPVKSAVIQALAARKAVAAMPEVVKALADADAGVRKTSATALGAMGDDKAVSALIGFVNKAEKQDELDAAEKALVAICDRAADRAKAGAPIVEAAGAAKGPAKASLLRVMPKIGDAAALGAVKAALKDADAPTAEAALRVLADWPDAAAAPDLLDLAKNNTNATFQVLALRGYIRLAGVPADRPAADKLKMLKEAMDLAKRPDEKKMALAALGEIGTLDSLKLVDPCIDDKGLCEEACQAAVKIGGKIGGKAEAKDVAATMEKVLQNSKNKNIQGEARKIFDNAKKQQARGPMPKMVIFAAPDLIKLAKDAPPKYDTTGADKLGWKLAVQAWSFNSFTFYEAVDKTAAIGLHYIEAFPGQKLTKDPDGPKGGFDPGMSDETIAAVKKKLDAAGVKVINFGVCGVPGDEAGARKVFEWARKLGIETLVTESGENDFAILDKLCDEFKINIALHNHPKESHYWSPDTVLKGIEGHSKRIGSCSDTGHWVRSGLVPIECLKKLDGHVISLHFKDLAEGHDVPWGTGKSDAKGQMSELKRQGFKGVFSIEYEHNWGKNDADMAKCAEFFFKTASELAAEKAAAPAPKLMILAAPTEEATKAEPPKYDTAGADKLGWKLAVQAWSFNSFTFYEAVDKTAAIGLHYIEAIPGQKLTKDPDGPKGGFDQGMSDETIAAVKKKLDAAGVKVMNFGVCGVPGDEAGARKMFEWAKKVGLETLVTESNEKDFPMLGKLCDEFKINIALHNHPKESHYWNPDTVLKGVEGQSKRIGSCSDTGHWIRSGLVPVECLKKLDGHVISLHFKDLADGHDVPWGTGKGDVKGQLTELKRQGFKGVFSIEYEHNWGKNDADMAKCAEFFFKTANELAGEK